jgi:hypothetical protein
MLTRQIDLANDFGSAGSFAIGIRRGCGRMWQEREEQNKPSAAHRH